MTKNRHQEKSKHNRQTYHLGIFSLLMPLSFLKQHQSQIYLIAAGMFVCTVALILGKIIDMIFGKEKKKEVIEDEQ